VDAIVLDVSMSGISGLEVCRVLRERGDRTPVLMLSGLSASADQAAGLASGADAYMTKPFDLDDF
jgi:DNA-binding response OmpR family regulator